MTDLPTTTDPAEKAADERAQIVAKDLTGYFWRGILLHAWTHRRELLFQALRAAMLEHPIFSRSYYIDGFEAIEKRVEEAIAAMPENESRPAKETMIPWTQLLPDAACVLWLAHHSPSTAQCNTADMQHFISMIMEWADECIAPDELIPAVTLAHELRTAHQKLITLPRPDATTRRRDAGN